MVEYYFKYYIFKACIKKQSIIIRNALEIQIFNNFGPSFKTYLTVINN